MIIHREGSYLQGGNREHVGKYKKDSIRLCCDRLGLCVIFVWDKNIYVCACVCKASVAYTETTETNDLLLWEY